MTSPSKRLPVSLHISLAPGDLPHAGKILPHQLRHMAPHVSEVVLTIDGGNNASPDLKPFIDLAKPFQGTDLAWNIRAADHSSTRRRALGQALFGKNIPVPHVTYRRGPCLSYYDGWAAAKQPYLFHLDSDMLLGGNMGAWLTSSLHLLEAEPRVFACNPLPGPPHPSGTLNQPHLGAYPGVAGSYSFDTFTSRLFLVRTIDVVNPSPPMFPAPANLRQRLRAHLDGLPRLDLPENLLTRRLRAHGQLRVDHPGPAAPAFSLHPPHRNADFYRRLTELIGRAEADDFPAGQRGCYDVNATLIDWSPQIAALRNRRWWRVVLARFTSHA